MAKKTKVKQELKFYQKLILNRYLLKVFGADKFEDIASDLENVQERFDDFKEDVKENYKPIPPAEHVCYDERTW